MLFMISGAGCERGRCVGGLPPVGREQRCQIVAGGHGRKAFEHVGEPGFGVVAVTDGVFQQGVQDGSALTCVLAADKEPVALAHGGRAEGVFEVVVVDLDAAVGGVAVETLPECEGVGDGFAHGVAGKNLALEFEEGLMDFAEDGNGVGLTDAGSLVGAGAGLTEGFLNLIEALDVAQGRGGEVVPGFEGFVEFAPGVGPAGGEGDAGMFGGPGVVGGVAVCLEDAGVAGEQVVEAGGAAAGMPLEEDVAFVCATRGVESPVVAGGAFAAAGIEVSDGAFVGLENILFEQVAVGEFVERFEGVGGDVGPAAEGVARKFDSVAALPDGGLAVEGQVVAEFGDHGVGDEPRGGAQPGAHEALDENGGGLIVEAVGLDTVDLAPGVGTGFDGLGKEEDLANFEPGEVAGFARGAWCGGGGGFSRRCVGFSGGFGFFCGFGIQQEFELGGIERLVLLVEELAQDEVELLAKQGVLGFQSGEF